jgi:hypothetical protein
MMIGRSDTNGFYDQLNPSNFRIEENNVTISYYSSLQIIIKAINFQILSN